MIWICLSIYILGAFFTFIFTYISIIRKYLKENSCVKFYHWLEGNGYYAEISFTTLFWFVFIPIVIILSPIKYLIKRINRYYNIE